MEDAVLADRLARIEGEAATNGWKIADINEKLEKQAALLQELFAMDTSLAVLKEQMEDVVHAKSKIDERLSDLECKPARRWDTLIGAFISGIVGIVLGFLANKGG